LREIVSFLDADPKDVGRHHVNIELGWEIAMSNRDTDHVIVEITDRSARTPGRRSRQN
jgi:hypothetical protein